MMVADECEFNHEGLCIGHLIHKGFKCKGMKHKIIVTECTLTNDDLVDVEDMEFDIDEKI